MEQTTIAPTACSTHVDTRAVVDDADHHAEPCRNDRQARRTRPDGYSVGLAPPWVQPRPDITWPRQPAPQ